MFKVKGRIKWLKKLKVLKNNLNVVIVIKNNFNELLKDYFVEFLYVEIKKKLYIVYGIINM